MATDAWVLQALVDANDQAVFVLDGDLRYLAFNKAHLEGMRALYGAEIEVGGRLTDYQTVAADREGAREHVGRALHGERVVVSAFSGEEGRQRFYDLVHTPLVGDDGAVVGVVVRTYDVTDRTQAERALQEHELSLATLVNNVPDVVFHIDRDYRLVLGNAAFSKAIGDAGGTPLRPGDPILSDDFPEDFIDLWHGLYDRALAGESFVVETTVPSAGGVRTMENHLRPVLGGEGAPTGAVVTSRDITERRRTEEVRAFLARTGSRTGDEPFFEALARHLASSLDMDFVCIDRLDPDGLTAHTLAVWTDGHFEDNVSYALKDTPCGDVVRQTVCCFPEGVCRSFPHDGVLQELHAESYVGVTLFDHSGRPIGLIAVIGRRPLTDRRPAESILELVAVRASSELERLDAERELRHTHEQLDLAQRASGAGMWDWDIVSGEIDWSPEMFALFGLDAETEKAGFEAWGKAMHPDDAEIANARVAKALADHANLDSEYRVVLPDGEVRWIAARGRGVYDEHGEPVRMSGLCIDVTEGRKVAEELRETRDYLENLFGYANAPVIVWDPELRITRFNRAFEELTQRSADEVVGKHLELLFPEDERRETALEHVTSATAGERWQVVEIPILRADGEVRTVLWNSATVTAADGLTPIATIAQGQDITSRLSVERELRQSEEDFRTLAEAVPQIVWMTDPDGKNTYFNQKWVDYTGMTLEESYGDGWLIPFHPDDRQLAWEAWQRATQGLAPYSLECRLRSADGTYRWWLIRGAPLRDESRTILKWFGTCTDIEEITLAGERLRRSQRNLAQAERIGGTGSWDYDVTSDTASWSENMFQIFDVDPAMPTELVFTRFVENLVHPADRPHVLSVFQDALAGKRPYDLDYRVVKKDGSVRDIHAVAETTRDEHGNAVRMTGRVEDITERKKAEAEVRRLNERLEQRVAERTRDLTAANAELEDFVHSIAHDLRSPLRALSGFSELIELDFGNVIDDTGRDYLRRIRDAAEHLGRLMDALLSLSQIGRRELELRDVDLSALALEVSEELQATHPKRIVDVEVEQGLVARGDPALCEIIVQNLVGNAWKFSAAEEHALIRFSAELVDGRRAFCVSDNGVGFDPEFAGKLFTPFERLHTRDEFPGTGIGLATVRRAVTRLGGRCWADAEQGSGARVYFSLDETE